MYGHGGVASGIPFGDRAVATETSFDSIVFWRSRVADRRVKVSFFAQLSVRRATTPDAMIDRRVSS